MKNYRGKKTLRLKSELHLLALYYIKIHMLCFKLLLAHDLLLTSELNFANTKSWHGNTLQIINSPEHSRNTSQTKPVQKFSQFMILIVVPAESQGSPVTNKQRHSQNTRTDMRTSCHIMECMDQLEVIKLGKYRWTIIKIDLLKKKKQISQTYLTMLHSTSGFIFT